MRRKEGGSVLDVEELIREIVKCVIIVIKLIEYSKQIFIYKRIINLYQILKEDRLLGLLTVDGRFDFSL